MERPHSVVLSTPVWGAEYVRLFCDLVLNNLAAPGNIPALASQIPCTYHIYTNDAAVPLIKNSPAFRSLAERIEIMFHSTAQFADSAKYSLLTACYNDAVAIAAGNGSALIFLNGDMIYSNGTFEAVLRRMDEGKRCVEIEGFRTVKQAMERHLKERYPDIIDIPTRDLVKLSLDCIHPISRAHFWEAESDFGFIPFHTYWRAGNSGVIARASHIYPLYLYPRLWELICDNTIDWDLVDKAGLAREDIHIVEDSDEIFSSELSDESYIIAPTFPEGCSVKLMRSFIAQHCSEDHKWRLGRTIHFKIDDRNAVRWNWARFKSRCWYLAIARRSVLARVPLFLADALWWVRRTQAKVRAHVAAASSDRRQSFQRCSGRDPAPYFALASLAPEVLTPKMNAGFRTPFKRRWLASLDRAYESTFMNAVTPIPSSERVDICMGRDAYFGTGWRLAGNGDFHPYRDLGQDGSASIYAVVPGRRTYSVSVTFVRAQYELLTRISLSVNGSRLTRQFRELTSQLTINGVIPPSALPDAEARIKLSVSVSNPRRGSTDKISVGAIEIAPYPSLQASLLELHGRDSQLHAGFCRIPQFATIYEGMPPTAGTDENQSKAWLSRLDACVVAHGASLLDDATEGWTDLSGNVVGAGWGRAAIWGSQTYRWVCPENAATLLLRLTAGKSYRLKIYVYTAHPDGLRQLRASMNGEADLPQELTWETDRWSYSIVVDKKRIPESGIVALKLQAPSDSTDGGCTMAFSRLLIEEFSEERTLVNLAS